MAERRRKADAIHDPAVPSTSRLTQQQPQQPDSFAPAEDIEMSVPNNMSPKNSSEVHTTSRPAADSGEDVDMIDVSLPRTTNTVSAAQSPPSVRPLEPRDSLAQESPFWFWQLILMTTAWMHTHYHTPHRACTLLLKVLRSIFICLMLIKPNDKVPVTLTTTFKRLGLNEDFEIRAICPQCRRAYPEQSPADLMCSQCNAPLFNTPPPPVSTGISLISSSRAESKAKPRPVLQSPYLLPSTQIIEFLNRDGNEIACESYLTCTAVPGKMRDIQDGKICQSLKGPDGRKFFETGPNRPDPDELRIGLCFGEDG
ncbi:hypothetical protein B0H17DRAFT_1209551 [Mycena rosella]|uniref:Uncharacterized protein n=1 Tax=Mycena rosella TaxID=1033263 RepID=A0AAD7G8C9_MYCRO|nr:hypothetical protein B0H17DRAFT_1209551 [Mycena rosella]